MAKEPSRAVPVAIIAGFTGAACLIAAVLPGINTMGARIGIIVLGFVLGVGVAVLRTVEQTSAVRTEWETARDTVSSQYDRTQVWLMKLQGATLYIVGQQSTMPSSEVATISQRAVHAQELMEEVRTADVARRIADGILIESGAATPEILRESMAGWRVVESELGQVSAAIMAAFQAAHDCGYTWPQEFDPKDSDGE